MPVVTRAGVRKVWLPAIRAGTGSDVFVERLALALENRGIESTISWFRHWYELFPDLLRFAKAPSGAEIIHANSAQAFAFKRKGIPLVATELHYILDPNYRCFKSSLQHVYHRFVIGKYLDRSYRKADAVTAISAFTAEVLAAVPKVEVTRTIPLWVDLQAFVPAERARDRKPDELFRMFFVGNASRRKGADVLPQLAEELGSGFEIICTAGLRQQMRKHRPNNVRILGRLSEAELVKQYQDCDAVLVPSRYEGFGYSALEAMACAKPVVGFRCGAIDELVVDGSTALLADIDDIEGLAQHCRHLAADPTLCRRLGEAGRFRAEQTYSEDSAIAAFLEVYESLLGCNSIE